MKMGFKRHSLFIGICGVPGVGKTTFATILCSKLAQKNIFARRYKMCDWGKAKLCTLNLPLTRENMLWIGLKMKKQYGREYWANLVLNDLLHANLDVTIIETGWGFSEMIMLKNKLRDQFVLIFVSAPIEIVLRRICNRASTDKEKELKKLSVKNVLKNYNIKELTKMADLVVYNTDSIEKLEETCEALINKHLAYFNDIGGTKMIDGYCKKKNPKNYQ